jgi:hypothetical protein
MQRWKLKQERLLQSETWRGTKCGRYTASARCVVVQTLQIYLWCQLDWNRAIRIWWRWWPVYSGSQVGFRVSLTHCLALAICNCQWLLNNGRENLWLSSNCQYFLCPSNCVLKFQAMSSSGFTSVDTINYQTWNGHLHWPTLKWPHYLV